MFPVIITLQLSIPLSAPSHCSHIKTLQSSKMQMKRRKKKNQFKKQKQITVHVKTVKNNVKHL